MVDDKDVLVAVYPGSKDLRRAGYELVERIGEGGMGEVWAAVRIGAGGAFKPCAIKLICPRLADHAVYRQFFVAEGRVAMMLSHSGIVSVFDMGAVDGRLFMAMDWVDGVDLGEFRQRVQPLTGGRLAVAEAIHIVAVLLDTLGYTHGFRVAGRAHGIVHRDISPRNVMVSSVGEIRLMDFGLAGVGVHRPERAEPEFRGTLRYLSREQARGRTEPASDLYAVGAILHELLDGRPFRHDCVNNEALMTEIFEGGIPVLERRVPPLVEALRRGLLEPRVELRIKSARQALTRIAAWPGYRNRRLRLESLYRQAIGEPQSGLTRLLSLELDRKGRDQGGSPEGSVAGGASPSSSTRRTQRPTRGAEWPGRRPGEHEPAGSSDAEAIPRGRAVEQAAAHPMARFVWGSREAQAHRQPDDEALDRERTRVWHGRVPRDESATAWLESEDSIV